MAWLSATSLQGVLSATVPHPAPVDDLVGVCGFPVCDPLEIQGSNRDIESRPAAVGCVTYPSAVQASRAGFQLVDHLHRPDLGRSGDGARRKCRSQQLGEATVDFSRPLTSATP